MSETELQIEQFFLPFNNDIANLGQQLRKHIMQETKPTVELVGDSTVSLNIGYGFTEKAWDCYCAIIIYSKHINISFPSGASLSDPQGILHGTGKRIRHIKIKDFKDIETQAAKNLLLEAREKALALVDENSLEKASVKTIVRQISGTKKRSK